MKPLVTSYTMSNKLKLAGFPQTTANYWHKEMPGKTPFLAIWPMKEIEGKPHPAAPTVQELADEFVGLRVRSLSDGTFAASCIGSRGIRTDWVGGKNMAESLAALYLKVRVATI